MFVAFLARITIFGNDQANGIVNFASRVNITINEPSPLGGQNSDARIQIVRAPGIYGLVRVPFTVIDSVSREATADVTPSSGMVVFQDREASLILAEIIWGPVSGENLKSSTVVPAI